MSRNKMSSLLAGAMGNVSNFRKARALEFLKSHQYVNVSQRDTRGMALYYVFSPPGQEPSPNEDPEELRKAGLAR